MPIKQTQLVESRDPQIQFGLTPGSCYRRKNCDSHLCEVLLLVEDVHEAEDEDGGHVNGQGDEEHEEVAIVPASDAVVDPRTVVVKNL